jgi:hypothetical protein
MEAMGFEQFLNWLLYGGGAVMASSWLLEQWAWFQGKTAKMKQFIAYSVSALFGVGAYAMVTFGSELISKAEPFFMILASVFSMIFLNNAFHKLNKGNG